MCNTKIQIKVKLFDLEVESAASVEAFLNNYLICELCAVDTKLWIFYKVNIRE